MSKFILGTAQFGSDYGIKRDGQPSIKEIEKIAQIAWGGGIRQVYTYDGYNVKSSVEKIFKDFSVIRKRGVRPDWFEWDGKRGLSVYENHEPATNIFKEWDAFQFPVNILDHRFLKVIKLLKQDGYEIHARSVFLQGLLLMDILPKWASWELKAKILGFKVACYAEEFQFYEAALGWVLGLKDIDYIIIGVNNAEQLKQLLKVKPLQWDYNFSIDDENILNPRKWPKA